MDWIKDKLDKSKTNKGKSLTMSDRVIILLSKTGSGKSTSIAPNLYLRFFNKYKKRIIITQPRVLTAIEIPKDIANIDIYKKTNYLCHIKEKVCICNEHANDLRKIYDGIHYKPDEKYISWFNSRL
jgi:hypothetical protein